MNFGEIPQVSWAILKLRENDKNDPKLCQLVWQADFLSVPDDQLMSLITQYRDSFVPGNASQYNKIIIIKQPTRSEQQSTSHKRPKEDMHEINFEFKTNKMIENGFTNNIISNSNCFEYWF